jgi:cytochrome c oxidase subunit 2
VPGTTTRVKITPTKVGTYEVVCTELCGLGHSVMRAQARVLSSEDYEAWLEEEPDGAAGGEGGEADGQTVFNENGCAECHALADAGSSSQVGPNLDTVLQGVDADYVRTAIVEPNEEISEGFQPGVMPQDYGADLSDQELNALVDYLLEATGGGRR